MGGELILEKSRSCVTTWGVSHRFMGFVDDHEGFLGSDFYRHVMQWKHMLFFVNFQRTLRERWYDNNLTTLIIFISIALCSSWSAPVNTCTGCNTFNQRLLIIIDLVELLKMTRDVTQGYIQCYLQCDLLQVLPVSVWQQDFVTNGHLNPNPLNTRMLSRHQATRRGNTDHYVNIETSASKVMLTVVFRSVSREASALLRSIWSKQSKQITTQTCDDATNGVVSFKSISRSTRCNKHCSTNCWLSMFIETCFSFC